MIVGRGSLELRVETQVRVLKREPNYGTSDVVYLRGRDYLKLIMSYTVICSRTTITVIHQVQV